MNLEHLENGLQLFQKDQRYQQELKILCYQQYSSGREGAKMLWLADPSQIGKSCQWLKGKF